MGIFRFNKIEIGTILAYIAAGILLKIGVIDLQTFVLFILIKTEITIFFKNKEE